jgi:hypothetical protein
LANDAFGFVLGLMGWKLEVSTRLAENGLWRPWCERRRNFYPGTHTCSPRWLRTTTAIIRFDSAAWIITGQKG